MKINNDIKNLVKQALKEDIGSGDVTSRILVPSDSRLKAVIIAKQSGVIAGLDIAGLVFSRLDKNIKFKTFLKDGIKVANGEKIAEISGPAKAILTAERTALNFLAHLSGIATLTRQFIEKCKPYKVKILDTRKTLPGLRILEKYAVKCGGGQNHRMGLWDGVLIKDNHIAIVNRQSIAYVKEKRSLEKMITDARKKISKNIQIEIEVRNLNELKDALRGHPDVIMLDNMSVSRIKQAVKIRKRFAGRIKHQKRVLLEVSGGVTLKNIRNIAKSGVDRISIGSLTHSAPALDLSLGIKKNFRCECV